MSIVYPVLVKHPDNSPVVPIVGSPDQYNPFVQAGSLRPWTVNSGEEYGDASGGTVRFTFEFRPAADDRPVFVTVNQLFVITNDPNAQTITLASDGFDWERPLSEKMEIDVSVPYNKQNHLVVPSNPVTLGKGVTDDTLQLHLTFEVNTNLKRYEMFSTGFVSDRPFLTSRNTLPL